jgi:hypothetical protein
MKQQTKNKKNKKSGLECGTIQKYYFAFVSPIFVANADFLAQ